MSTMSEEERDSRWQAALADSTPADAPAELKLLADAARQALRNNADRLTPSAQTTQIAWDRLRRQIEAKGLCDERRHWLGSILSPRCLALAFSLVLAAGIGTVWWAMQRQDSGIVVVAMRGEATVIAVADADTETPALVAQMRALNLAPEVTRQADGTRVDLPWPVPPSDPARAWLLKNDLHLSPDGKLHLYLVKPDR